MKKLKFMAPHGASGLISLVSGAVLSFCSIFGNYSLLQRFRIIKKYSLKLGKNVYFLVKLCNDPG